MALCFESARITARLLAEDLGLDAHWQAPSAMAQHDYEPATAEGLMNGIPQHSKTVGHGNPVGVIGGGLAGLAAACVLGAREIGRAHV